MTAGVIVAAVDLLAVFALIYGLKQMSSPATAVAGIRAAGLGMVVAVLVSFLYVFGVPDAAHDQLPVNAGLAVLALLAGCGWAWWTGSRVLMTAMPQMVAVFNGMGGGAAAAIAAASLSSLSGQSTAENLLAMLGGLIGCVSLSGSVIAWAKLDGRLRQPCRFTGQRQVNAAVIAAALLLGLRLVLLGDGGLPSGPGLALFLVAALLFGVMMTLPIGGADMPVVISLYNAFTGLAVALDGYLLQNPALMIAGMVVGSAGTLVTLLMARAMNRSIGNVLFANFGAAGSGGATAVTSALKTTEASDAALAMRYAHSVIIVPGYGLAVAQAQHKLYELVKLLQSASVDVKFAIHPVAGR
ncbi:MAG: NAD(P)(+) transhydrogenase (Re/Si-specific) subunit beta, partial [Chloroflexi bacterium]|nr:NAD(P)(+) transhydrogenase (Re/Si-specific) subunit beta [Chloroflexota bacterium]